MTQPADRFADLSKFQNDMGKDVQFGDKVSESDKKKLKEDFEDVFELLRNLSSTKIPPEYTYSQYQTFLSSMRLGLIETYIIDYFMKFSNRRYEKGGRGMNIYNIETDFGDDISIEDFFRSDNSIGAKCFIDLPTRSKEMVQHNLTTWMKISILVIESQMKKYGTLVLSNISFQDVFKMMIPMFVFNPTDLFRPIYFNQRYFDAISISLKDDRKEIKLQEFKTMIIRGQNRFALKVKIDHKISLILGIHGEKEDKLRFSRKQDYSSAKFGNVRKDLFKKFHDRMDSTRKRREAKRANLKPEIDKYFTSSYLDEFREMFVKDLAAVTVDLKITGGQKSEMFTKIMKRVKVKLYKHYNQPLDADLEAHDFDPRAYNNEEFTNKKLYVDNGGRGDTRDQVRLFRTLDEERKKDKQAFKERFEKMEKIYNYYSFNGELNVSRDLPKRIQWMEGEIQKIERVISDKIESGLQVFTGSRHDNYKDDYVRFR
jgi:hypothetical protein